MDEDEDDDEEQFGNWSAGRRGMAQEDTSMKKIKTVQGKEGSWTVTDCDADRKGDKWVAHLNSISLRPSRITERC